MIHSNFHHYCARCDQDFVDEDAKQKHLRFSDAHYVCQWCDCEVGNYDAHFQKYHLRCDVCDQWCADPEDRHHHYRNRHSDLYCALCGILFTNHNNLRMHLKSSSHLPRDYCCPGGRCDRSFISRSALIRHFEADVCMSGFNLEDVDREFSEYCDRKQVFVKRDFIFPAPRMDIYPDEYGSFPCPDCPKTFGTGHELAAHLQSPKHKNRGYRAYSCPSRHCNRDAFFSLGNLLLHMETTDCQDSYAQDLFDLVDNYLLEAVRHTT
ncbi:hypothetical protein PCANC_14885 [Puccinia coronata f. sp. avenae]|uniref:C2H2-type domain-containing protein n=1 Tax=Puccinia coronata f. sp. avenae TaxID=200324 RepID=A0A2N5UNS6_9BASI|nr:hypothetical protein PCANC_14885 [Puccinia coronata f. sp. avenae]